MFLSGKSFDRVVNLSYDTEAATWTYFFLIGMRSTCVWINACFGARLILRQIMAALGISVYAAGVCFPLSRVFTSNTVDSKRFNGNLQSSERIFPMVGN